MFKGRFQRFSEDEWKGFHRQYCQKYRVDYERQPFVNDFLKCAIVDYRDGQYMFRYSYAYYYFVAKYLSDNLHVTENADLVRELSSQLEQEEHASVWLFLTHLSKNPLILQVIIEHARTIFSERAPANFEDDSKFIRNLQDYVPEIKVSVNEDFRTEKEKRLEEMDAAENRRHAEATANAEDPKAAVVVSKSSVRDGMRTIQILGQVVRNFPGSLEGDVKEALVRETYQLGLRMVADVLTGLREHTDTFMLMVKKAAEVQIPPGKIAI